MQCALEFADASFDIVIAARAVHHLPDIGAFSREALRVLKPGGFLLLLEPQKYNPFVEIGRNFVKRGPEWRTSTELTCPPFLVPSDLRLIKSILGNMQTKEFEFLTSPCLAFRLGMGRVASAAMKLMRPLDNLIRNVPMFRRKRQLKAIVDDSYWAMRRGVSRR
jgi:ubiquinone/menaquinone biosynthesis C-methylase UbiE